MKEQIFEIDYSEAQKRFGGKKRSDLKDSDFLFPKTRSFPIVTPADIKDAIRNFGRMKGAMSYEAFFSEVASFCEKERSRICFSLSQSNKRKIRYKELK